MAYRKHLLFALLFWSILASVAVAQDPWSFIVICDSRSDSASENNGVNTPILAEIANEIVAHNVDFILYPGDLVFGEVGQAGMQSQFRTWRDTMQIVYDANIGVYPVRGNHDMGSPSITTAWRNVFFFGDDPLPNNGPTGEIGMTYSLVHKNAFIVGLEQCINYQRFNQTWLNAQLAANTKPHIFVFGHFPAFKTAHGCLDNYPTQRNTFWASLKNAGCRTYFCAHDHFFDHAVVDDGDGDSSNDIHQYIVGTGGAERRSWSPPYNGNNGGMTVQQIRHAEMVYGYILVKVINDTDLTMIWYQRDDATGQYAPVIGTLDLDSDGVTDLDDVDVLAQNWLRTDCRIGNDFCDYADIDQSTTVDMVDLALLCSAYLE